MADSVILDSRQRPFRKPDLKKTIAEPRTTSVRSVLRTQSMRGIDPARLAAILRAAETPGNGSATAYLELAEHMEEVDLHYLGVLETRKRAVAQLPIVVEPASDQAEDQRDADLVKDFFGRRSLADELFNALDAVGKGFSISEIMWETSESQWLPSSIVWRQPTWFDFDADTGERLLLRSDEGEPTELPPGKFLTVRVKAKSGLTIRGGLARVAAWSWLFKSLGLKDWARFVQAYGAPIRLGRYPPGVSDEDMDALERAVANVAADAAAVLPEGMSIEFVADASVRGRSEVFRDLIGHIDNKLSIAVLGQTLTTETSGTGSYALGQVHDLVRHDIERSDAAQLAEALERDVVQPIVALNHGPRRSYPKLRIERPPAHDGEQAAKVLSALVPLGFRVKQEEVHDRFGWSMPAEGDPVLAAPLGNPAVPGLGLAKGKAVELDDDPLTTFVDSIDGEEWRDLAAPLIEPILQRAKTDPEGLLDDLAEVYPELDADALTEKLARVLFVADIYGSSLQSR